MVNGGGYRRYLMRRVPWPVIWSVIACLLVVAVTPARAQSAGAQAEALFRDGRSLMKAGKLAEACAAFEQSQKLEPAAATLINLAGCREELGQLATAWRLLLEVEQQTRLAADQKAQQFHQLALERAARLEPRVSKLTFRVPDERQIDGLEIRRDQERIPAAMWNRPLPVDGGTYAITARAPGTREWSTRITLASEADARTVDIPDLRKFGREPDRPPGAVAGAARSAEPPRAQPPRMEEAAARRGSRALPIVVGVGGAALLGGALGSWLWADSTYDKAKAEMSDQARRDSLYDSANRKRYAAEGLAIAAAGCTGVAIWLYVRQQGGARAGPEPARVGRLTITPTASGIALAGRF